MNNSVAPSLTWRLTLLLRWIAPVSHAPGGTTTRPPPALLQAAIAWVTAAVQSVFPPGIAPNSVMAKSRFGNVGALMRAAISSAVRHETASAAEAN